MSRFLILAISRSSLIFFLFIGGQTFADPMIEDLEVIAEGGRLYDKWWEEYDLPKPTSTHPAYPLIGKKSGATTWRCKECHGWDYRGRKGAYAKGSHYTGIKGIENFAGRSLNEIVTVLKDKRHAYDSVMLDFGLKRIAAFVSGGQLNMSKYIDAASKKSMGEAEWGRSRFEETCKECHGKDGRERNFKDDAHPEYVGSVAKKNPWEALHKIRNGQPGAFVMGDPMPHMNDKISLQEQIDLLSYMQTLPEN